MLLSCVIDLQVNQESLVPPSMGQVLHAFFLDRVRLLDQQRSEVLHRPDEIKPFTLSPLWGKVAYQDYRWRLFPGEHYTFRITSLDSGLSRWLSEKWLPTLVGKEIVLAGAIFLVAGFTVTPTEHPWAGLATFEEIYNRYIECRADKKVGMYFYSPTTFRVKGNNCPLPEPRKVFLNLLHKWNRYSPVHLGDNFTDYIEANVNPGMYKLETKIMHFDCYKQVGFTGTCWFNVRDRQEAIFLKIVHMLAAFSFYAGVGYKTTMGMGQCKKLS